MRFFKAAVTISMCITGTVTAAPLAPRDSSVSSVEPVPEGVDYVSRILKGKSAPPVEPVPEGVDYVSRILKGKSAPPVEPVPEGVDYVSRIL